MPKKDHKDIGDILSYAYNKATVVEVFRESPDVPSAKWDTATVRLDESCGGFSLANVPIFYHCGPEAAERTNGSLDGAAAAFVAGDSVIVMSQVSAQNIVGDKNFIVGHMNGARVCTKNLLFFRSSATDLVSIKAPLCKWESFEKKVGKSIVRWKIATPLQAGTHVSEHCTFWDIENGKIAKIKKVGIDDTAGAQYYTFPCTVEEIKPLLDTLQFIEEPLFDSVDQGSDEYAAPMATASWRDDFSGVQANVNSDGSPYSEYFALDDVQAPIYDISMRLISDGVGARNGTLGKSLELFRSKRDQLQSIADRSPGCKFIDETSVVSDGSLYPKNLVPLRNAVSCFFGYGDNQIYVCGKNTYMGIVVSYCDEYWKFQRMLNFPPNLSATRVASERLSLGTSAMAASPITSSASIASAMVAMAAEMTQMPNEDSIFSFCSLKNVKESGFHHYTSPAIRTPGLYGGFGSKRLIQRPVPGDPQQPVGQTAINTRLEAIGSWYRGDNWTKSLNYSYSTYTVDRTWFFVTMGMQFKFQFLYLDTPIGTMYAAAPRFQTGLWNVSGLFFADGTNYARQDYPLDAKLSSHCIQTPTSCVQIYIVSRSAVSFYNKGKSPSDEFHIQHDARGPYDCHYDPSLPLPEVVRNESGVARPESSDPVSYVGDDRVPASSLTDDVLRGQLADRVFTAKTTSQLAAVVQNMNEVEVAASASLFKSMLKSKSSCDASLMDRSPALEIALTDVLVRVAGNFPSNAFVNFATEARIA